ncbi:transposase [Sediminitomix flava]|uniref:Transposase n=1 Tax=Sediminitomix flava TaxID=379075 RepID=A0A315ZC07_SEDFL|nr:transposase [Sediminitomix flava]PWJ42328.1 hypothetical protein BC781_103580 [Sediminitomix flava]
MEKYDTAFKEIVLDLLSSGYSISQLAKDYQASLITLSNWLKSQ